MGKQEFNELVKINLCDDTLGELKIKRIEGYSETESVLPTIETLLNHLIDDFLVLEIDLFAGVSEIGFDLLNVVLDALVDQHFHKVAVLLDVKVVA